MKINWLASKVLAAAVLASAAALPAVGQVGIYIGHPPPPLRYEARPPMPGPGYAWQDGYWNWAGSRYAWVGGRWNRPPYQGAYWEHPHYDHFDRGWAYHEGHWDHEDHGYHHDWGRR